VTDLRSSCHCKIYVILDVEKRGKQFKKQTPGEVAASFVRQGLGLRTAGRQQMPAVWYRYAPRMAPRVPARAGVEKQNARLRCAISDLMLDKPILQEAGRGAERASRDGGAVWMI